MKKNLRDEDAAKELIERVNKLSVDKSGLWGAMEVTEMIHHCNKALKATLDAKPSTQASSLKQKTLQFLFLNVLSQYPKNAKAPRQVIAEKVSRDRFEIERQQFIDLINEFVQRKHSIEPHHPIFGRLDTRKWGVFTWMHLDHHLRQFGV